MKLSALAVGCIAAAAGAAHATNAPSQYYGNVTATGAQACSAISGVFPAVVGYQYSGTTTLIPTSVVLKILIQNPAASLAPQYIVDYFTPTTPGQPGGSVTFQDPQLLGSGTTLSGITGTYTGNPEPDQSVGAYFSVNNVGTMASFTVNGVKQVCQISFNGILYFTP